LSSRQAPAPSKPPQYEKFGLATLDRQYHYIGLWRVFVHGSVAASTPTPDDAPNRRLPAVIPSMFEAIIAAPV
jgi:hypothetical protein